MSDKVVVMNNGEIQQVGTPIDVYNEPANRFVANFIGKSNIIDGIMIKDLLCSFDGKEFECVDKGFKDNENVDIVIRPEDIDIVKKDEGFFNGIVISEIFKGVHYEIHVQTENRDFLIHTTDYHGVNEEVGLIFTPDDIHIMEKWSGKGEKEENRLYAFYDSIFIYFNCFYSPTNAIYSYLFFS